MKKVFTVLILLAVIAGCVVAAGCTAATTTPTTTTPEEKVAYTITVTKDAGSDFNVGDILSLTMPTNPSTGYDWHLVKGSDVLYKSFSDSASITDTGLVGAPSNVTFWFQADKEGDFPIELVYARENDIENTTISRISDTMHVVLSDTPLADGPKASFVYDSFNLNQGSGKFVKIVALVNPTPKSTYTASGDGLTIKGNYEMAKADIAGSKDTYTWYVTAAKPGDYLFKAVSKLDASNQEVTAFTIPLKFT